MAKKKTTKRKPKPGHGLKTISNDEYFKRTKNRRRALARRAEIGYKYERVAYERLTNRLARQANKALIELKKNNIAMGRQYNMIVDFIENNSHNGKLMTAKQMGGDIQMMLAQNEAVMKFLKSPYRSVKEARRAERYRIRALKKKGIIPSSYRRGQAIDFLNFLGSEATTAAIDGYGLSDVIVDIIWDIYKNGTLVSDDGEMVVKKGKKGLEILERAFMEFNDRGRDKPLTFDQAMDNIGVKVEDYLRKRDERIRQGL